MTLSVRQIRAFQEVAEAASFTGAAERLNLTQSAVSMLIRQLEEELGIPLFVRTGRGARLTEFGIQIRPTVLRVLADLQNITDGAADLRSLRRGHLRMAVPQMLGCCWLPPVLAAFRSRFPDVGVSVLDTTGDRVVQAVAEGDAEIGIGPERPLANGVAGSFMWNVPMQVVVSRQSEHARHDRAPGLEELGQARWIHYSDDFSNLLVRTILTQHQEFGQQDMRVRGMTTALALVATAEFMTVAPGYASLFEETFGVRFLDFEGPASRRTFLQYSRDGHELSPAAQAFLDIARSAGPKGARSRD